LYDVITVLTVYCYCFDCCSFYFLFITNSWQLIKSLVTQMPNSTINILSLTQLLHVSVLSTFRELTLEFH